MRGRLAIVLLTLTVAAFGQLTESDEVARNAGDGEHLHSSYRYAFRHARVSCELLQERAQTPRRFWRFGAAGIGRFAAAFLVPQARLAEPDETWLVDTGTGMILARARLPFLDREGHIGVDMAEIDGFRGWLFFRLTTSEHTLAPFIVSARTQGYHASMGGMPSRLHLVWPGGMVGAGEQPPWDGRAPRTNALAFFARGPEADRGSDLLVFQPEDVANLRLQRWDSVAILTFAPTAGSNRLLFALGTDAERNAEDLAIPQFLANGRHRIAEAMQQIDWDPPPADFTRIEALIVEIDDFLARHPDPALAARLSQLQQHAEQLTTTDLGAIAPLEAELRDLAETAATRALKILLAP